MQYKIKVPYGKGQMECSVDETRIIGIYTPTDININLNKKQAINEALDFPIGCGKLEDIVKTKKNAVLICDDNTRPTPVKYIVPAVLDRLNKGGIPDSEIVIVIALGTHRYMKADEILDKFGKEVYKRVKIVNHLWKNPRILVDLGEGVKVNRLVYTSDFKIGIGNIVPHHICGYSGGAKIIQPGICGEETTAETHLASTESNSYLGVVENPIRHKMEEIADKVGLDVIFNTVLDRNQNIVRCFFGDTIKAFRKAIPYCDFVYSVDVKSKADIVIAGSHPCDLDFWQAHKTLYPADRVTKKGGTIIIVSPCYEGISSSHPSIEHFAKFSNAELYQLIENHKIDGVAAALMIAWNKIKADKQVFFVSRDMKEKDIRSLGFTPFSSLQEAVDIATKNMGKTSKITVLKNSPEMLPK